MIDDSNDVACEVYHTLRKYFSKTQQYLLAILYSIEKLKL